MRTPKPFSPAREPPKSAIDLPDAAQRRQALTDEIADIVLHEGLQVLALRGLADRLNTSARMLMYYFGSKESLVVETVERIVLRLQAILARFDGGERQPAAAFLAAVLALTGDPEVGPFMNVLTDLVTRGAQGETPYDRLAEQLVASWVAWIDSRLLAPAKPGQAAALLGVVEGVTLLERAAMGSTHAARAYLIGLFEAADGR
jgi:AcrR family transcriptional regulator